MNLCGFTEISPKVDDTGTTTATTSSVAAPKSSPTSSSTPPPYATGTCCFHLVETETCESDSDNLYGHVTMYDGKKNDIGETTQADPGVPMNAAKPYSFTSKLKHPLVITGEHSNDYVQFNIDGIQWTSSNPGDNAHCDTGGWDPRQGPTCTYGRDPVESPATRQMDCCFPCDGTT